MQTRRDKVIIRASLLAIVLIGFLIGILSAGSTTESIIWVILGIAGLLGVATWGTSSKETIQTIKNTLS